LDVPCCDGVGAVEVVGRWGELVVIGVMLMRERTCGTQLGAGFVFARGVGTAGLPHCAEVGVVGGHAEAVV
jgi:hypothetical protein